MLILKPITQKMSHINTITSDTDLLRFIPHVTHEYVRHVKTTIADAVVVLRVEGLVL